MVAVFALGTVVVAGAGSGVRRPFAGDAPLEVRMSARTLASAALSRLPPTRFAFAYGSAVKRQTGAEARPTEPPLLDLGLAVADARRWHSLNFISNRDDYSFLKVAGPELVALCQRRFGAKVYFNTLVPLPEPGALFKYGVVSERDLLEDLTEWRYLYFAGRLHKPVTVVVEPENGSVRDALRRNLEAAARCSLLLLPERFTRFQLFHAVSNLSYSGDFRMIFGENKNKVRNIVAPQLEGFGDLYEPALLKLEKFVRKTDDDSFAQDSSEDAKLRHLADLPLFPKKIILKSAKNYPARDENYALKSIAEKDNCHEIVARALRQIVWQSSVRQSIKGIFTAGLLKSLNYSARKIKKMFQ